MIPTVWHSLNLCPGGELDDTTLNAAIAVDAGGVIRWVGPMADLPSAYAAWNRETLHGAWVTPGLIDCHTHHLYGGQRADEFAERLAGVSYEHIWRRGGGILSTVRATRAASEDELFSTSASRLEALLADGVTTVEIKSGYGLDYETERKMLRVARQLAKQYPVTMCTTFLGAHALPPDFAERSDACIDEVCERMLPGLAAEGLVDAVDVFCERIAFTTAQSERVFDAASRLGLPVKIHTEQLSNMGGAALAARYHAVSADHLEFLDEDGVVAMREGGTTAVLLPSAFYFIRETKVPPLNPLRQYQVPIAVATDSNPGTSPCTSLLTAMNMAATFFRMTVPEVLQGVTVNAARALGRADLHGKLEAGRKADFAAWSVRTLAELVYWFGRPLCKQVVRNGRAVFTRT